MRRWWLWEVLQSGGWSPDYCRVTEAPETSWLLLPFENTVRTPAVNREEGPSPEGVCASTSSSSSSLQDCEKEYISVVCKPPSLWWFIIASRVLWDKHLGDGDLSTPTQPFLQLCLRQRMEKRVKGQQHGTLHKAVIASLQL